MDIGKGIKDGGGYDLAEIEQAENQLKGGEVDTSGLVDVEPLYIEVIPHDSVHHTEEYEARMVILDYDEYDNVIGVELL